MDERTAIRRLMLRSRQAAHGHMDNIRAARPLTYEYLHKELYQYILVKYLLTEEDRPESDSFDELSERSLAKSMQVSPELVEEFDTAQSCDGATSVMAKKVLLYMAIEKALCIEIPALESARLKTMHELTAMVYRTIQESPLWAEHF